MIFAFIFLCFQSVMGLTENFELVAQNYSAPIVLATGIPYAAQNMSGADAYTYYKYTLMDPSADLIISLTGKSTIHCRYK